MSNPNKAKGAQWERDARDVFIAFGHTACARVYGEGCPTDVGDLTLGYELRDFCLQAKNWKDFSPSVWLDAAKRQAVNKGARYPVAVVKRRGKNALEGYAVMTLGDFAHLLAELRTLREGE